MSENCQLVVFSNKAYNAIIRESFDKDPVETGGILLGHVLDNGVWIVMEVLPPGINSIFQYAYFEYDEAFVNYLAQSVANQYKHPLDLLGLWHRHPGSMDYFSTTDDGTNVTFARQNSAGVISGLVNIDPNFRITMYHLDSPVGQIQGRPRYSKVDVEVGDDIIPDEYFELRYYGGSQSNLHPKVSDRQIDTLPEEVKNKKQGRPHTPYCTTAEDVDGAYINCSNNDFTISPEQPRTAPESVNKFLAFFQGPKIKWLSLLLIVFAVVIFLKFQPYFNGKFSTITNLIWNNDANKEIIKTFIEINEDSIDASKSARSTSIESNRNSHLDETVITEDANPEPVQ